MDDLSVHIKVHFTNSGRTLESYWNKGKFRLHFLILVLCLSNNALFCFNTKIYKYETDLYIKYQTSLGLATTVKNFTEISRSHNGEYEDE